MEKRNGLTGASLWTISLPTTSTGYNFPVVAPSGQLLVTGPGANQLFVVSMIIDDGTVAWTQQYDGAQTRAWFDEQGRLYVVTIASLIPQSTAYYAILTFWLPSVLERPSTLRSRRDDPRNDGDPRADGDRLQSGGSALSAPKRAADRAWLGQLTRV